MRGGSKANDAQNVDARGAGERGAGDGNEALSIGARGPGDPYEAAFRGAGYAATTIPVLSFAPVNEEALVETLEHPGRYDGLILTSPRAVGMLRDALRWLPGQVAEWEAKPVYAVGPRTASDLEALGFEPRGESSGSAEALVARIISDEKARGRPFEAPLLFVSGTRSRRTVPDGLREADIACEEIQVYDTRARGRHQADTQAREDHQGETRARGAHQEMIQDLRAARDADWLVFFSPSGVQSVLDLEEIDVSERRCAAIGPTTAAALQERGIDPAAVADEPAPQALVRAIGRAK